MKIKCNHSKSNNKLGGGSRITVYTDRGAMVGQIVVPKRDGVKYCEQHPAGIYAKQLEVIKQMAVEWESVECGLIDRFQDAI